MQIEFKADFRFSHPCMRPRGLSRPCPSCFMRPERRGGPAHRASRNPPGTPPMSPTKLKGVIAAVATPVNADGSPDTARATKLARYLIDNGCDGLNVLGTTGEATSFSLDERKRVMDAYKSAGLPLDRMMVGTGAAAVADAVALTRYAAE